MRDKLRYVPYTIGFFFWRITSISKSLLIRFSERIELKAKDVDTAETWQAAIWERRQHLVRAQHQAKHVLN